MSTNQERQPQPSARAPVPTEISDKTENPDKISGKVQNQTPGRTMIPLGKPKSGRVWKDRNKQRYVRDVLKSCEQKMDKNVLQEKRKRREENLKRREENEKKAEIVQVIRNTAKLKRMKKKQLRKIEKRDTLSALQKTPPTVKKASKGE
ncbi:hypothetical protein PGIGA_G00172310 [Pangasianodon gigas]|uniref:Uncharacterized protein n=1 Tax=Pangasianodon gigas TaxID=30993 RepID=A0ACC5XVH0_PANGG|nr:hypothetical protein [Pangasianodon gigas]